MLNAALVGLLAGSFALGPAGGDDDKKNPHADKPAPQPAAVAAAPALDDLPADPRSITQDTYALGIPSDMSPIKIWASYALGEAEGRYDTRGNDAEVTIARTNGDLITQRLNFGAQINAINFPMFKLGAGAQLGLARNEFQIGEEAGDDPIDLVPGDGDSIESEFGLQNVKVYGIARGRVLGVHGGYMFDLGEDREFEARADLGGANIPTSLSTSDGRDAIFVGANFDVPSDRIRLFGGLDYYMLQGADNDPNTTFDESTYNDDDFINFLLGLGLKFSVVEVGAAFQIQTRLNNPIVLDVSGNEADGAPVGNGIGGHIGTVAPYLRISPPQIPASIFVKGAVQDEYTEFGIPIGGANSVKPKLGFTAGLSVGFE